MSWILKRWLLPNEDKSAPVSSNIIQKPTSPPTMTTTRNKDNNNNNTSIQQLPQQQSTQNNISNAAAATTPENPPFLPNNAKLLLGGLVFFSISTLITRRALIRKHIASIPPFYTSSVYNQTKPSAAMDAFEALNIATINTVSVGMILAGGTLSVFGIDSVDTARARLRKRLGYYDPALAPSKEEEEEFEKDIEAWLVNVFDKKDLKELRKKVEEAKAKNQQSQVEEEGK